MRHQAELTALSPTQSTSAASRQEIFILRDQPNGRGQKAAAEGLKVYMSPSHLGFVWDVCPRSSRSPALVKHHQSHPTLSWQTTKYTACLLEMFLLTWSSSMHQALSEFPGHRPCLVNFCSTYVDISRKYTDANRILTEQNCRGGKCKPYSRVSPCAWICPII